MSICPINFNWKQILEPHVIQVEPSYGEIGKMRHFLSKFTIFNHRFGDPSQWRTCSI
jgi:hypothetical protein